MNPEFAAWLVNLGETLGKGFAIFCLVAATIITIFGVWCAISMQREEKVPSCFGKPITPNGMAEAGCDGCPLEVKCDAKRK